MVARRTLCRRGRRPVRSSAGSRSGALLVEYPRRLPRRPPGAEPGGDVSRGGGGVRRGRAAVRAGCGASARAGSGPGSSARGDGADANGASRASLPAAADARPSGRDRGSRHPRHVRVAHARRSRRGPRSRTRSPARVTRPTCSMARRRRRWRPCSRGGPAAQAPARSRSCAATSGHAEPLERRFLARARAAGLPLPETNRPAGGHRVDCRWPGTASPSSSTATATTAPATPGSRTAAANGRREPAATSSAATRTATPSRSPGSCSPSSASSTAPSCLGVAIRPQDRTVPVRPPSPAPSAGR